MSLRIAFAGTGCINKIHAVAAQNAGAELVAAINPKLAEMAKFVKQFKIPRCKL